MRFKDALVTGRLVRRYKRFLADIDLDGGERVTAHCANPGSMMGLAVPGARVFLSRSDDPKRKLAYSWEIEEQPTGLVGINTAHPNTIVAEAILAGKVAALAGYQSLRREVKYGVNSRVDILLTAEDRPPAYVEVKNVHLMRQDGLAEFPDSVTSRGAKHLQELADRVEAGERAVMVYLVQRGDCDRFALAADLDPAYAKAFAAATARGVEAIVLRAAVSPEEIVVTGTLPFHAS